MAVLVWFTIGIALWHFTVFVPDRFWAGIVGAFLGATIGAVASGAIVHIAAAKSVGETDIGTALAAVPGCLAALAIVYLIGLRNERDLIQ